MPINPIDYILDVPDPLQSVLGGFQAGTAIRRQPAIEERERLLQGREDIQFGQQQTLFGQGQQDRAAAQAEVERQRAEAKEMQADIEALNANPEAGAADFSRLIAKWPQLTSAMTASFNLLDTSNKESTLLGLGEVYSAINSDNIDVADGLLSDRVEALRNSGRTDEAAKTEAMLEILRASPEAAKTSIGLAIKTLGGSQFDSLLDTQSTVQTSKAYGDGTVLKVFRDGTTEVTNPAGEVVTGEAAESTIATANAAEIAQRAGIKGEEAIAVHEADIAVGGEAAATVKAATQAITVSKDIFDNRTKILSNMNNIDRAISAIDAGAKTGLVYNLLPNISQESAELKNALDGMGLDVISAITFGALSEKELKLAMDVAAPRNLSPQELKAWLVERRDAQQKVADMMLNAAEFLSTPGNNINGWIKQNKGLPDEFEAATEGTGTLSPAAQAMLAEMGGTN